MSQFELALFDEESPSGSLMLGGVDDMNFIEVLHNVPGARRPQKGRTISVAWKPGERSYYVEYSYTKLLIQWEGRRRSRVDGKDFYVRVETPDSKGLPTNLAGDVLVALMKLTAEQSNFRDAAINTSRYELLKLMRWHINGHYYKRLRDILSQFTYMAVSTNALWDPRRQCYYEGDFNILDSWRLEESESNDPKSPLIVRWGQETLNIFRLGYMKHLDTDVYYRLPNPTTKRIYRWLDKHLSLHPVVEIDVLRFAHKVLGYGVSYTYPSQVTPKLAPKFDILTEMGFVLWEEHKSKSDSGKKYVFTRLTDYSVVTLPRRDYIVAALSSRGVARAEHLVDACSWECCLKQLAHHEWRVQQGKEPADAGAWLATAIREDYPLPKPLAMQMNRAKQKTARWCEQMYGELNAEDRDEIDHSVRQMVEAEAAEHTPERRLQLRNQLLLSRIHEA
jgi:hypothetical protein